ncbi:Protein vte6, chloroplastic [Turnera subulata]|uniref:Protein vte6, chloroplastic n=1 Tax=Turnera subulata TaxID=218843 RepID=A0A9Q0JIS7_9ROSI|nr:Protein vte6, chloroplastic [Turnera subulata]
MAVSYKVLLLITPTATPHAGRGNATAPTPFFSHSYSYYYYNTPVAPSLLLTKEKNKRKNPLLFHTPPTTTTPRASATTPPPPPNPNPNPIAAAQPMQGGGSVWALKEAISSFIQASPPTWHSALFSNFLIFLVGSPLLLAGLSLPGILAAFLLGTLTWRAFGPSGFLLVASYFVIGTAATKVKMAQKEAQGVAEKKKGRRGPASVIGSSAAGCVCAFLSIYGAGGAPFSQLCRLGFVASFCTKLNDTVSSEIGKAYGKITYLVTTFKVVPRGTEGAVSVEGTLAGLFASIALASVACLMGEVNASEAVVCVIASQIANLGESIIGAALQEKKGFEWLGNDFVNVINISMGSILAVLMQQFILQNWHT